MDEVKSSSALSVSIFRQPGECTNSSWNAVNSNHRMCLVATPRESGDLIERIGRTWDAYECLFQTIVAVEVSPQAHDELKRLHKITKPGRITAYVKDGQEVPLFVNLHAVGIFAYKVKTESRVVTPNMAIARFGANRSRLTEH